MNIQENINEIYEKYGLYSKCYYLGNKEDFTETQWTFLLKTFTEQKEEKAEKKYKKYFSETFDLTGKKFLCRIYYRGLTLAYIEFTFLNKTTIYIDGLYREDKNLSNVDINIRKLSLGKILLISTLIKAYMRGAETATLIAQDLGSGKLYDFYYKLGFKCIHSEQRELKPELRMISTYHDFFSGTQFKREERNIIECYMMIGNIKSMLESIKI